MLIRQMSQKISWLNDGSKYVICVRGNSPLIRKNNKAETIMCMIEDYADSYGSDYYEGFTDGWNSCDYETECGYNDEAHFDPYFEGYLQGYKENVANSTESDDSAAAVLKGLAGIIKSNSEVPMHNRFLISVEEASKLYGIGVKTLYRMIRNNPEADFILEVGSHYKIKRELFEEFLKYTTNLD